MWVARDKDLNLHLFPNRFPFRDAYVNDVWFWSPNNHIEKIKIDSALFPDLTWEDEPLEVDIVSHII